MQQPRQVVVDSLEAGFELAHGEFSINEAATTAIIGSGLSWSCVCQAKRAETVAQRMSGWKA
jgi:hypothetical protein